MDTVLLESQPRQVWGKKVAQLRRQGVTPIHLYGSEVSPLSLQADTQALQRVVAKVGQTSPVTVRVNGADHFAFVREVQRHPVTNLLLHVDFLQVALTSRMVSRVPIHLVGEAPAVRMLSGMLMQALHDLEVESLPADIPPAVEVDVSSLENFEKAIHVSDISLGPEVDVLTPPETLVARVQPPRAAVEEEGVAAASLASSGATTPLPSPSA